MYSVFFALYTSNAKCGYVLRLTSFDHQTTLVMKQKLTTSFGGFAERNCTVALCLDIHSNRKDVMKYPLCIRFIIDRKSYYHKLGGNYTKMDFSEIVNTQKSRSDKYEEKRKWRETIDFYADMLKELSKGRELPLDMIRAAITGKSENNSVSFLGIWQEIINAKDADNHFTTAESYTCALKSFKKILGENSIIGLQITIEELRKWDNGMKNGIMIDGKLACKIADATRGIYLRAARIVWKECNRRGYLLNQPYPFSNKKNETDKIYIPKGGCRKKLHLDVEKMTELYRVFMEKRYPESWSKKYKDNVHYSLGLFLAQYLCNGFNLADAAELTYDEFYYATDGKAFRFERKKTRTRSENEAEVIIPIIDALRCVLDEIAAKPEKGALVFPDILNGHTSPKEVRQYVSQANSNVQDRVIKVCEDVLHWKVRPSSTWCRHSFANNLRDAGVEREYISESMGHSLGKTVTGLYLDTYPLKTQFEYNGKLLNIENDSSNKELHNLSKEETIKLMMDKMGISRKDVEKMLSKIAS